MATLDQLLDQAEVQNRVNQSAADIVQGMERDEAIAHLQHKMEKLGFTPDVCAALEIEWRYDHGAEAVVTAHHSKIRIFDTSFAGGGWYARGWSGHDIHFSKTGETLLNAIYLHLIGRRRAYKEQGL